MGRGGGADVGEAGAVGAVEADGAEAFGCDGGDVAGDGRGGFAVAGRGVGGVGHTPLGARRAESRAGVCGLGFRFWFWDGMRCYWLGCW